MSEAIATARARHLTVTLLYADLDRFKIINDSLGHVAGDLLLQATASRLLTCVGERGTVARTGGDEFVVVLPGTEDTHETNLLAQSIVDASRQSHAIDGVDIFAPLSIGIAEFPRDGRDTDTLMRAADAAMYRAKDEGGARTHAYAETDASEREERLGLETQLRRAIASDELVLHYQPIVTCDGETTTLEALVRWQHPTLGLLGPDRFIHIAEESGLIYDLGAWVLRTASAEVGALRTHDRRSLRLAVNVSTRQFRERGYGESVVAILHETGFDPSRLDLEITESVVMHDVERAIETMRALRASRIRISVDDFGTGHSSLAYLQRFPIDTLKIDRRFTRDLPASASDVAIVESIVTLAHNLGLRVIAEGIETRAQFDLLERKRCDEMQGFFISRPLAARDLATWLAKRPALGPQQTAFEIASP